MEHTTPQNQNQNQHQPVVPPVEPQTQIGDAIQHELDIVMDIFEETQALIPEGEYLRGMNALGALHRHKRTTMMDQQRRRGVDGGELFNSWVTIDEIQEQNEDLFEEIMELADEIVVELCGDESSIYSSDNYNLVHRGDEQEIFFLLLNYKPEEGNAGYESTPLVLHHAIKVIMTRLFNDTFHELEIVRPVSCQCGWRGVQGNWDRHINNARHQRWVIAERERKFEIALARAREIVIARRELGIVYLNELQASPATKIATAEAIAEAEAAGNRVVYMVADGGIHSHSSDK